MHNVMHKARMGLGAWALVWGVGCVAPDPPADAGPTSGSSGAPAASSLAPPSSAAPSSAARDAGPTDAATTDAADAGTPDSGPPTAAQLAKQYFVGNVWPVFTAQNCAVCHRGSATPALNFLGGSPTANSDVAYATLKLFRASRAPYEGWPLLNLTQHDMSVILLRGEHASGVGPPFGETVADVQRFVLWAQKERAAADEAGTYVPDHVDGGGMEDASQPDGSPDAGAADAHVPDPFTMDGGTPIYTDPFGGMIHHNLTPTLTPDEVADLLSQEGPPEYAVRIHGCSKLTYAALGNVLRSRGATPGGTALTLYTSKAEVLGALDYRRGKRESIQLTTGGAAKFFDIVLEAAPDVAANLAAVAACADPANMGGSEGGTARLFNDTQCGAGLTGCCLESGVTCLLGMPATADHLAVCDEVVRQTIANDGTMSVDPVLGKSLALGTLMAGAFLCE